MLAPTSSLSFVSLICFFGRCFVRKYCLELDICSESMDNKSNNCLLYVLGWEWKSATAAVTAYHSPFDFYNHLFLLNFLFSCARERCDSFVIKFAARIELEIWHTKNAVFGPN